MAEHRTLYKNSALDSKELRRRREEKGLRLRKEKRDEILSKRRTLAPIEDDITCDIDTVKDNLIASDEIITKEVIQAILQNENSQLIIENAGKVRRILSKEPQPPFDEVIQSGLIPRFIELLDRDDETTIQFEVAWILTNICSGTSEQTRAVVDEGAVPKLIRLMRSPDLKVCEQAVWALGNVVGDGADLRDLVLSHNFVPALLALIRPDLSIDFLRNETWVLVNLCRNKDPPPSMEVIEQIIPALIYLIDYSDISILTDTTWAVSYITELGPKFSQLIIDSGLLNKLTPLISHKEIKIQTATIRALGSIVTGDEIQTQSVIDAGALPHLHRILKENNDRVVKEALWFISNITAGPSEQIQAVIDNQLIPSVIHYLDNGDFSQQKEAAWIIYNMSLSASMRQIQVLIDEKAIPPLCNLLSLKDTCLVRNVLEALCCILNYHKDDTSDICYEIEACGGLDKIENLQHDENSEIYNFAYTIIDKYFTPQE